MTTAVKKNTAIFGLSFFLISSLKRICFAIKSSLRYLHGIFSYPVNKMPVCFQCRLFCRKRLTMSMGLGYWCNLPPCSVDWLLAARYPFLSPPVTVN